MIAKFKNFFEKQPTKSTPSLSEQFDHSQVMSGDVSQCPFMAKQSKKEEGQIQKCPITGKEVAKSVEDSDSQEQKPKGGCPFMGGTSDKKKNPNLCLKECGFDEPFVSKFKFYLSSSKLDFSQIKNGHLPIVNRELFNSYPIYLKHTLFYNGQDYKKVRNLQCCSRFMAYDQLREKGNKKYNKKQYYQALDYYQRALSLFRWIEYQEPLNQSTASSNKLMTEQSLDEMSQSGSKMNINMQEEKVENPSAVFDELKTKYKQFFTTYSDDNTRCFDGQELMEAADIDMRKSLLIQIYLNMCATYINTHHYSLAEQICNDGLNLSDKVSQLYFRKAQALSMRKDCTIEQLQMARQCIGVAIERRGGEKIFSSANNNILKMLNIHDSEEAYQECKQHVEDCILKVKASNLKNYQKIYNRTIEINEVEKKIIADGKVPKQGRSQKVLYNTTEMKIIEKMVAKYIKVIEFYTEAKNNEQVLLAKKQFQQVLRIKSEVNGFFDVKLQELDDELGGLDTQKIRARIAYVKTDFAEVIYNAGKFNFTMLEWVIKEIVKQESQEKKKLQEKQKEKMEKVGVISLKKGNYKLLYLLMVIPLIVMGVNMFIL